MPGAGSADSGAPAGDASGTPGSWHFVAEPLPPAAAPAMRLVLRDISGSRARLDVVLDNVARVSAVAFRLAYQPGRVVVASSARSQVWAGAQVIDRFKSQDNGQLWAGIGTIGVGSVPGGQGTVVATVAVDLYGDDPLPIRLLGAYSRVLTPEGAADVSYAGGRFEKR